MQYSPVNVWPGPMEGVSQEAFVRTVNQLHLTDRWMTPFLRISQTPFKSAKVKAFLAPYTAGNVPVTAQLMGPCPEPLAETARQFIALGAAGINLNCGCPSSRVVSGNAGGGALRDIDQLCRVVENIRKSIGNDIPFSVKMRTGYSSPGEMRQLLPRLADAGADCFFIHYRTVQEQYRPVPGRTERLKEAVEIAAAIPVIINGNIADVNDGKSLLAQTGAAGIMIARGFLRDPWLLKRFNDCSVPSPDEGRKIFFETLKESGAKGGNLIELAKLIWGTDSDYFRSLIRK